MPKKYIEFERVKSFMEQTSEDVQNEYRSIVDMLEKEGRLSMPFGEKVTNRNLFVIRVIHAANIRIFYVYGKDDFVYGISAYEKKTQTIPKHELSLAIKIASQLRIQGVI